MTNDICKRQSCEDSVKIAAAFRYAYGRAKFWKSWVWSLTVILAVLQLIAAINHKNLKVYLPDDLAAMVVTVSLTSMLMATLGRHYFISRSIEVGGKLQRLHDFKVLGLGVKPTVLEVSQSQIDRLSSKWLNKRPDDRPNISEWWPNSVAELPENLGITLCLFSTFRWESELRNKYALVLIAAGTALLIGSLVLMHVLGYQIAEYVVKIFTPISPLIALLVDEWLLNSSGLKIAQDASRQALTLWDKALGSGEIDDDNDELNRLNYLWSGYRSSASPIFDWLYWLTQKTMNKDMIIDASSLVSEYMQKQVDHGANRS